ncbi:phage/plasmid primase, P4 family [Hamadaea sp. NPDC050747]|uniref:phage/plasmid primase, P4 family n=1 Tax=Hamadaea sp. NPDC050747 TaxID=3155789 RepID=UPI0033F3C4D3
MVTLDEFLSRFPEVVDEPDGWVVPCPAHSDSRPSLRIAVSEAGKILLKCRAGCSTGKRKDDDPDGIIEALGMSWADLDAIEPGDVVTRATSTSLPAGPVQIAALAMRLDAYAVQIWDESEWGNDTFAARQYAADRFGVADDDVRRLGLGLAFDLGGGPRLVVPFRDKDGIPRGYQARALDPAAKVRWLGPKSPDGASWAKLAWLPADTGWSEVIVTEGPGDGLTACAVGYDTIAVRGAGLAGSVADDIVRMASGRPIVVCGDADPAGDSFTRKLAADLAKLGAAVRKLRPPVDGDDITAWRERQPDTFATEFVRAVQSAQDPGGLRTRMDAWTDGDLTDVAAARRLREHFERLRSGVRYSPEAGFFILRDGVWRVDKLDEVRTHAQEVARSIWDEAAALAEALDAVEEANDPGGDAKALRARVGKLKAFAKHANSTRGIDSMVRELQALSGVAADVNDFDKQHHLLAVRNGVVDLRSGALLPHDPSLLLTRRVDLDYDPQATAPRWEAFLGEVFPDYPDLPEYTRRLVGYGITGETAEQCFAVLWGTGANGKSVFTDCLTEVFRELTVTTPFSTFEERGSGGIPNDIAALKGARLVMAAEGEQGRPMAEAVLKRVTGRDLISARFMRREFFEFRPTFLLMLATNFKPSFRGQDEGLWRRVKLIPWTRYFKPEERDHKLGDKLAAEAQGILTWAVRGAVEWYRDGLGDPAAIRNATAEYRQTSDALAGFLPGVFIRDADGTVPVREVWDAYREWAEEEALPLKERWQRKTLYAALDERGISQYRTASERGFRGLRRTKQADEIPGESPAVSRTPASPLAHRQSDNPLTGASLADVFQGATP